MGIALDLGFELLVAVCDTFTTLATLCDKIDDADWTRAVVICMGQARDRGQRDADAPKKARSVFKPPWF